MTTLLDTSVLIRLELGGLTSVVGDHPVVSAISVAELAYGIDIGSAEQREYRQVRLRRVIRDLEVIPFGVEEGKMYGALATLVRAAGRDPRPRRLDLQIAATAAAARLPLVTANPRDFAGLGTILEVITV